MDEQFIYAKESWFGDSRDGALESSDGYHYFKIIDGKKIVEAYEFYQHDDGTTVVSPMPEMKNVDWIDDLGFENLESLEIISEQDFSYIKSLGNPQKN